MNNSPPLITEILKRSDQGMTRPFLCRAGGTEYFVKGRYAGQRSLCCEWVAGSLARLLINQPPLVVPPFVMAEVPANLIKESTRTDAGDLGSGPVFASLKIGQEVQELTWEMAPGWTEDTMAALLFLDLWLQNEDRSLSSAGGNPNLLVQSVPALHEFDAEGAIWKDQSRLELLWVYDFNMAFDVGFDRSRFFSSHVFGDMLKAWPSGFREKMEPRILMALSMLPSLFKELPDEWLYLDGDESLAVQLDERHVTSLLNLPLTDSDAFWSLP